MKKCHKLQKGVVLGLLMTGLFLLPVGCDRLFPPKGVTVGGVTYDVSTTDFVVSRSDFDDYEGLRQLEDLRLLDLSALDLTTDAYDAIAAKVEQNVKMSHSERRSFSTPKRRCSSRPTI